MPRFVVRPLVSFRAAAGEFAHIVPPLPDRIGCGLDGLQWNRVSRILEEVFKHTDISITIYSLPQKEETTVMKENTRR